MEKEELYRRVCAMITSSTKKPKHVSLSSVKLADLLETSSMEIEKNLQELIKEGKLKKAQLAEPPHYEIYLLL